ncbi:MAG: DUF6120 family protein [Anaerostipes sp.]|uniref:DUF6120 family protein n=1 Tax=Anaerostipes sp. 992a TaxID=1261637 RepID=UPI0009517C5A|nr:DUF6120 family protein [Anaerostipes sp. 992a]MCI5952805.1 DUF6120 family protein [Anaerostipes sp.]MDD5968447.1 DUF6120 family protein [Anaerostipes sp.]OLR63038.1 hypothetical protein BHF69_10290 [Anaerostipes sp. 992a]
MTSQNARAYCRRFQKEVTTIFPFKGKKEKEYLEHLQMEIEGYVEEFPGNSYEEMLTYIGTPKDVVESYFQHVDNDYLLSHMKKSRYIRNALAVIVGMLLILCVYRGALIYQSYRAAENATITEIETTIEEE